MDRTRFTEAATGTLVKIDVGDGRDWAFVPNPLPPDWKFPERLWPVLAEAREQLARLDQIGRTVKNPSLLLQPLQKREALRSSSLEGTYATAKELLLYELDPRDPTSRDDPANSWREVSNYDSSMRYGFHKLMTEGPDGGLPLCNRLITDMHGLLMQGVRGDRSAGEFRRRQVHVGSNRRYVPPPPGAHLDSCLKDFELFLNSENNQYDALVLSYLVHYQFEAIHPFLDGNGRVGRSLLSLTTFLWNRLQLPWLYMSAYFERYKDEYVDNMFRVSTHGDWETWIEFCLNGTIVQAVDAIDRCEKLNALREQMLSNLGQFPRMHAIVEGLFFSPVFTASQVAKWGSVSLPTARQDIRRLVELGFVSHLQGERPRNYFVPLIFSTAYAEDSDEQSESDPGSQP